MGCTASKSQVIQAGDKYTAGASIDDTGVDSEQTAPRNSAGQQPADALTDMTQVRDTVDPSHSC